jgi:hypothetical protein
MDLQFYPTPLALAHKAWNLFKNRQFDRVLDPSAGNGDLLAAFPEYTGRRVGPVDAIEIDASRHTTLRSKGINVVGLDFEQFQSAANYSHIILNPPFFKGCEHVLRAWDKLFDGEIVAIINAETLRNPFSRERQLLKAVVENHGSAQFLSEAFMDPDTMRKTTVEVALVYLRKRAEPSSLVSDIVRELRMDEQADQGTEREPLSLALPDRYVENTVLAFNAAVEAMRRAAHAQTQADYYARLLGATLAERNAAAPDTPGSTLGGDVRLSMSQGYDVLKDRAWANVLKSTQVSSKLSSAARNRLESEFNSIKTLEFTVSNVYGFLAGLCESSNEIQMGMMCDVFDIVTKYHSDNAVHYMGWKSNDRHRTCGMRMRTTRFVIPGHSVESWSNSANHSTLSMLGDMDKVFAILDGKAAPEKSLVDVFYREFSQLKAGERMSSSYFDVRFYPQAGTIHFFATNKALVDRLNRLVGQHRQWLPPVTEVAPEDFWAQYDKAEKFDAEVRKAYQAEFGVAPNSWRTPKISDAFRSTDERHDQAHAALSAAISRVLTKHGIDIEQAIEDARPPEPLSLGMNAQTA